MARHRKAVFCDSGGSSVRPPASAQVPSQTSFATHRLTNPVICLSGREVTASTPGQLYLAGAKARALHENQTPGMRPGEGVRKTNG